MKKRLLPLLSTAAILLASFLGSQLSSGCGEDSQSPAYEAYVAVAEDLEAFGDKVDGAIKNPVGDDAEIALRFSAFAGTARRYSARLGALPVPAEREAERDAFARVLGAYADDLNAIALAAGTDDGPGALKAARHLGTEAKRLSASGTDFAHALEAEG